MKLTAEQLEGLANADLDLRETMALHLAGLGMKVFPMQPNQKRPQILDWPNNASSDPAQIKAWFTQYKNMNYGIACEPSGLVVVDLDVKHGIDGIASWRQYALGLNLEPTFTVHTPSGGMHLFYRASGVPSTTNFPSKAIDIRGQGGCVVGPGSNLPNGTYRPDLPEYFPDLSDISTGSEPFVNLLRSRRGVGSLEASGVLTAPGVPVSKQVSKAQWESFGKNLVGLLDAKEGTRNEALNQAAFGLGSLVRDGVVTRQAVRSILLKSAEEIGLSAEEARATVESGLQAGFAKAESAPRASTRYEPLDIIAWLSEDHPEPDFFGSGQILYKPGLVWVMGEPASGKSFLCLQWALDVMTLGKSVIWLDEEAGPRDTINKLKSLGATDNLLAKHFLYLQPEARNLSAESEELFEFVCRTTPGLIVMDSAAAILANAGIDEDKNSPVVQFMNRAVLPLVKDLELPVLVIDHKTKNKSNTSYARGASSKLGIVDMALNVELKAGFSKSKSGSFELKVNKDRSGLHPKDKCWTVSVQVEATGVKLLFEAISLASVPEKTSDEDLKDLIFDYILENPGCSQTMIEKSVRGASQSRKREVLKGMTDSGLVGKLQTGGRSGFHATEGGQNA